MLVKEFDLKTIKTEVNEALSTPQTSTILATKFAEFQTKEEEYEILTEGRNSGKLPTSQKRIYAERIRDLKGEMKGLQCLAKATRLGYEPYTIPGNYYVAEFDRKIGLIEDALMNTRIRRGIYAGLWTTPFLAGGIIGLQVNSEALYPFMKFLHGGIAGELIGCIPTLMGSVIVGSENEQLQRSFNNLNLEFNAPVPVEFLTKYQKARDTKLFDRFLIASPDFELFRETPRSLFTEPVLVGYIPENTNNKIEFRRTQIQREKSPWAQSRANPGTEVINGTGFLIAHWDLAKDRQVSGLNF